MRADRIPGTMGLLVFCALLLSAASPSAVYRATDPTARLTCAGNFTLREMACYSYSGLSVRRSFHHAERYCFKLRASLASLLSPAEENFVIQLADDDTAFWIGLTDQGNTTQAQFTWSDGTALMLTSHTHWQAGEPSNAGHLHCVQVDKDGWALARGGCASTKLPFVCKKHACPAGLEWSGSGCDMIPEDDSSSLPLFCHPLILLPLLSTLLLALCHHHYRTNSHTSL